MDQQTLNALGARLVVLLVDAEQYKPAILAARKTMTPAQQQALDTWSDKNADVVEGILHMLEKTVESFGLDIDEAFEALDDHPEPS